MSITFVNGLWKSIEAPEVFSSLSRFPLLPSRRSFPAYSFGCPRPSSGSAFVLVVLHIHNSESENTCSYNSLGKHCQIMFLRTFGGRRPPTAPMVQDNEGYILYPAGYPKHKIKRIHFRKSHSGSHHAFMYKSEASSSRQSTHVKLPKKKTPTTSNESILSFNTFDASYVLTNKSGKVVAKYVGAKHKGSKTCVWVPKVLVSNVKGPKTIWVPKNKA
jgi:hypothetical protein